MIFSTKIEYNLVNLKLVVVYKILNDNVSHALHNLNIILFSGGIKQYCSQRWTYKARRSHSTGAYFHLGHHHFYLECGSCAHIKPSMCNWRNKSRHAGIMEKSTNFSNCWWALKNKMDNVSSWLPFFLKCIL